MAWDDVQTREVKALHGIADRAKTPNKDLQKNLQNLNQSVRYISQMMTVMQNGIDDANKDIIAKIQDAIEELLIIFGLAEGGDTLDFDWGDFQVMMNNWKNIFNPSGILNVEEGAFNLLAYGEQLWGLLFSNLDIGVSFEELWSAFNGTYSGSDTNLTNLSEWASDRVSEAAGIITGITQGFLGIITGNTAVAEVISDYQQRITALEGTGVRIQHTASTTWTNPYPSEHRRIGILCINAGQNGTKGGVESIGPSQGGGYIYGEFWTDELPSAVRITVGASNGAVTSFGSYIRGYNGLGGVLDGEGRLIATSGAPGSGGTRVSLGGGSSAFATGGKTIGQDGADSPPGLPSGGGGGAGNSTENFGESGGDGGYPGAAGGNCTNSIGASGGAGAAGTMFETRFWT